MTSGPIITCNVGPLSVPSVLTLIRLLFTFTAYVEHSQEMPCLGKGDDIGVRFWGWKWVVGTW